MNNQITEIPSTLLRSKLARTALRLQNAVSPTGVITDFPTVESLISEANKILSEFYKKLPDPIFKPYKVVQDTVPDPVAFNNNFRQILDDFTVVFDEFENLETIVLSNFNYTVSKINKINRKLKEVSSSLGDFILFSDLSTKDAIFFSDSFNNLIRIESNSPLLNTDQCEINQTEGIVTLPIDRIAQTPLEIRALPVINNSSNGVLGNNHELNAIYNGDIAVILDSNPDTWFEYERVIDENDGVSLILDFTVNLSKEEIINFVRINPNNFGTKSQIEIISIDTSVDGKEFVSIKDDIPIAGFFAEDEENVFILAPSTSKFTGQGLYTFTPRKAKYVRFQLRQSSAIVIDARDGTEKFRYAIGIRDIEIESLPYKTTGEIISSEYVLSDPARKVVLLSNQKPDSSTLSSLATIDHYISPDNGITWHQIRARNSSGIANSIQTIPELLDFNGVVANTIITSAPVLSLRYKAILKRNTEAFVSDSPELAQTLGNKTELHTPPTTTPFELRLQNKPISNTLKLIDPQFGSRGKTNVHYKVALGSGAKKIVYLPFVPLKRDLTKNLNGSTWEILESDSQTVYIDGEVWSRQLTGSSSATSKHYSLNFDEGKLEFGDGAIGKLVNKGSTISMSLSEERIFPSRGDDHTLTLEYPTSNDKKQAEISIIHPATFSTLVLKKGAKRHPLKTNLVGSLASSSVSLSPDPGNEVAFIDGSSELTGPGFDYSIDYQNGILYLRSATSTATETSVSFESYPRTTLSEDEWDFYNQENNNAIVNSISIKASSYKTFVGDSLIIPNSVRYFNLPNFGIVRGTLVFLDETTGSVPTSLKTEVDFIDGRSELLDVVLTSEELDPILGVTPGEVRAIPFKVKISTDTSLAVSFSNQSVFQTEKGSLIAVTLVGDYFIQRTGATGFIHVKLSSNSEKPGFVNYYYTNPQSQSSGKYSVNYSTGEVFSKDLTHASNDIVADWEYTNYKIKYDVARLISSDDWTYDSTNNKILIEDREILKNIRTPQTLGEDAPSSSKFYQVFYQYVVSTRADVSELEPFFSPTLKDYALKVITESRLQ